MSPKWLTLIYSERLVGLPIREMPPVGEDVMDRENIQVFHVKPQMDSHKGDMKLFLTWTVHAVSSREGIAANNFREQHQ